jgi:dienelactone hydrolase
MESAALNGFVVIWPWGNNVEHSTQTELLTDECIRAACERFNIDSARVSLIGACGAGRDALIYAARKETGIFAVVAHEVTLARAAESARMGNLSSFTPLDYITQLSKMRVILSHGKLDRHVPVGTTLALAQALIEVGGTPKVNIIETADEGHFPQGNNQWIAEGLSELKIAIVTH